VPKPPPFRATAYDIACRVGVSQPTVSRALRGVGQVSEATRQKILEAARALNYEVDHNAARLRSRVTRTFALVVLCEFGEDRGSLNPFYFSLLGSIEASAAAKGYSLLVSFQDSSDRLFGRYEDSRQADGMIVIGSARNRGAWDFFRQFEEENRAVICWGGPDDSIASVGSDNHAGGMMAAEHLIAAGRTHLAFVGPLASGHRQFLERHRGFADALQKHGLDAISTPEVGAVTRDQFGYQAVTQMVDTGTQCDGIFAACDLIGLGALKALRECGIDVPRAVSVIGFDGIGAGALVSPALTTIAQDVTQAGALLVESLLDRIAGQPPARTALPVSLLIRESA
jgi:DNA-binding LacI/PurR family transcriptional regulator